MSIFFFYSIWTAVSAAGLRYSVNILLDKDITWLSSILIILSIQWIRLIKYPEQNKDKNKNVHVKLPQTNSNINKKRNR
jgi:hypothetical protein